MVALRVFESPSNHAPKAAVDDQRFFLSWLPLHRHFVENAHAAGALRHASFWLPACPHELPSSAGFLLSGVIAVSPIVSSLH